MTNERVLRINKKAAINRWCDERFYELGTLYREGTQYVMPIEQLETNGDILGHEQN